MDRFSVKKILHITPHLGGGVGSVLLKYFSKAKENYFFEHTVVCLDYANEGAIAVAQKSGIPLFQNMSERKQEILDLMANSDIVLIHWWNHPLLYDFLVREQLPPCRLVFWSHIAGFYPPFIFTEKILKYPDMFVLTTPMSFEAEEIRNLTDEQRKSLRVIWSTGGVESTKSVQPKKHGGFNIGYIGTVDYVKIHPRFLEICSKINIPDVKFIVCGGSNEKEIKKEADNLGIGEKFDFMGLVPDVSEYLSMFDVFGYPLAPHHYGTCDQVLAESMAAGVVPVVLQNRMEELMIQDGKTGIVAKNEEDYIRAVETLYNDKILRNRLSQNAREYALKTFSLDNMAREWEAIFGEALRVPKTCKKWDIIKEGKEISAKDVFLEALGNYGKIFVSYCNAVSEDEKRKLAEEIKKLGGLPAWQAEAKGTAHQYHSFFPEDELVALWSELTKKQIK